MGWWANFKANRELSDIRKDIQRARSPWSIAQFIDKCIELDRLDLALEEAEAGIREFPNSDALNDAYKRMIRAKCADDLRAYRDEIRKAPGPKAYYRLACLYKEMRDLDQAMELARKGMELYPTFEGNYIVLADIRYERFQRDLRALDGMEAISLFERAVDLNRENYRLLFQLAEIYRAVGARDHAQDKLDLIVQFAPDDQKALRLGADLKKMKAPKSKELKEVLDDFERRASATQFRKQGLITQRYTRDPGALAKKLPWLEQVGGFMRVVVLGPDGELLGAHPGSAAENQKYATALKRVFETTIECALRMEISTFENGMIESDDGYTYLLMVDRLQLAVMCDSKAKKEKIQEGVHVFAEHELYL